MLQYLVEVELPTMYDNYNLEALNTKHHGKLHALMCTPCDGLAK